MIALILLLIVVIHVQDCVDITAYISLIFNHLFGHCVDFTTYRYRPAATDTYSRLYWLA